MKGIIDVYLAGTYARRLELLQYSREMEEIGCYRSTAQWLTGAYDPPPPWTPEKEYYENRQKAGECDFIDCSESQTVIAFTDPGGPSTTTGGHHTEIGIALGRRIPLYIVGRRVNVFHYLPGILLFADWPACKKHLIQIKDLAHALTTK